MGNFDLPEAVREIAAVIGRQRALFLVGQLLNWDNPDPWRGKTVWLYVPTPKRLKPAHKLVAILGWDDAEALARELGGMALQLHSCNGILQRFRDNELRALASQGAATDTLAETFGITPRYVRTICAA